MANNITINTNTGTAAIKTYDDGSAHQQYVIAWGDVGSGVSDTGNPVKIGGKGVTSEPSAVTTAYRIDALYDTLGRVVDLPFSLLENYVSGKTAAMTGTSDTAVIAAQGSGIRTYVTGFVFANSHASQGTEIVIKDGSTEMFRVYLAAGQSMSFSPSTPVRFSANTAVNAANVTTSSNTYVGATGFKSKI